MGSKGLKIVYYARLDGIILDEIYLSIPQVAKKAILSPNNLMQKTGFVLLINIYSALILREFCTPGPLCDSGERGFKRTHHHEGTD